MKKTKILLSIVSMLFAATNVYAQTALTCNDVIGSWKGNLSKLHSVTLEIKDAGGSPYEDATIRYKDDIDGSIEVGGLMGTCQKKDEVLTMEFSAAYSATHFTVKLTDANQLNVAGTFDKTFGTLLASGTLTK